MYPFKKKIIGDISYNDYPFPFKDNKNEEPRFMKTYEALIEARVNEIIDFFETREDCQRYIIENELKMYLTEESFYKVNALMVRKYGTPLSRYTTFTKKEDIVEYEFLDQEKKKKMEFDNIIQNPPYNGSLHLDFLTKGLDLLSPSGRMVIIEPATWLINVRKNGKAKKYDDLKRRLEGHIESVVIENRNKDFGTEQDMPFATTVIDMSKTYDSINLTVCGEKRTVKSIYDCNLIGPYELIQSILRKVKGYGDMAISHKYSGAKVPDGSWFCKYADASYKICAMGENRAKSDEHYVQTANGQFLGAYTTGNYHNEKTWKIGTTIPLRRNKGGKVIEGSESECYYGTENEIKNWVNFTFNNTLSLFLNITLVYDMHTNVTREFLPWLVDKQYTNDEISQILNFTEEEIALMNQTVKKYERNSPWFKRYMCGPGSVDSDPKKEEEIINNFINNL